jgi:regulator of protease activity HflC (stomatin/prohibitin superfamily)
MSRQMSAERVRRAVVTEAEGRRESVVKIAEGEKAARILEAEGEKEARILQSQGEREAKIQEAEGQRRAEILRAAGYSQALDRIQQTAQGLGSNTMSLQYLETLQRLGDSQATKFVLPMEFTNLLTPILRHTQESGENGAGGS